MGFELEVRAADVDERAQPGEPPERYVARIARAKAAAVAPQVDRTVFDDWVLAADTTVTIDGRILGKAETPEEAAEMLRWLSNRVHQVLTAFILIGERGGHPVVREGLVATEVSMIALDDALLADYVASGEWQGKAGAYAVQGIAAALVREVSGSITNVIGLPLVEVLAALRDAGGPTPRFAAGMPA